MPVQGISFLHNNATMSTRFNTFGSTGSLATETTQRQIKDKIYGSLDVNVLTLPGTEQGDINIKAVAGVNLPVASNLPCNIAQQTLASLNTTADVTKLGSSNIALANGASTELGFSTQRVILASDQKTTNWEDLPIKQGVSGPLVVNNTQINGVPYSTFNGNTTNATQRVVLASDQKTTAWENVPTNIRSVDTAITYVPTKKYNKWPLHNHVDFEISTAIAISGWSTIQPNIQQEILTSAFLPSTSLFLPTAPTTFYVSSTSVNDTNAAGTGARQIQILYYPDNITLTPTLGTISLNGTTSTAFSNQAYRILTAWVSSVGASEINEGNIQFHNLGKTQFYPGIIPINRNQWYTSHIYFPNSALASSLPRIDGIGFLDYVFYYIRNSGGSAEQIRTLFKSGNGPWRTMFNLVQNNADQIFEPDLKNINLDCTLGPYDLIWVINRPAAAGTTDINGTIGYHIE